MDEATITGKSPNITVPATKPNTYAFYMEDSEWLAELKKVRRKRRETKDAKLLLEIVMNTESREWGDGKLEAAIE